MKGKLQRLLGWFVPWVVASAAWPAAPAVPPGARGVVRTALEGERVVELPLVMLGVYRDAAGPRHDLYLVRLEGPEAQRVGVAAGMSGSPVYVEGELVGALSYRFGFFPREAIGGVTPAADMHAAAAAGPIGYGERMVAPIATPVFASGVPATVRRYLEQQLGDERWIVLPGGGRAVAEAPAAPQAPLEPGMPIGVELIRGDVSIAATGTLTWIDGDRVYAFGHPLLGSGRVELPLVRASVLYTLPAMGGSVKLANLGEEIGAIVEDRLTAIVGQLGLRARTVPFELVLELPAGRQRFNFEIARHDRLLPVLVGVGLASALVENLAYDERVTIRARGTIEVAGGIEVPVRFALSPESGDASLQAASLVAQVVQGIVRNRFGPAELNRIVLQVESTPGVRRYRVEEVYLNRAPLEPGRTIEVACVLAGYGGERVERVLRLRLPPGVAPDTPLGLIVGSAEAVDERLGKRWSRRVVTAENLSGYLQALGAQPAPDRLQAVLYRRAQGAVHAGHVYEALPPTAVRLLAEDGGRVLREVILASDAMDFPGPLEGVVALELEAGRETEAVAPEGTQPPDAGSSAGRKREPWGGPPGGGGRSEP